MTGAALFLLVLTSLAPIGMVHAAVLFGAGKCESGAVFGGCSLFLSALCGALLYGVLQAVPPEKRTATELASKESEPLAFFVAYALPLVAAPSGGSAWGMLVFAVLMGLVIWQQQIFHVNPLLALLGYHFFAAKNDKGAPILVLTRERTPSAGVLSVVRLSDYLWLQCRSATLGAGDDFDPGYSEGQEHPAGQS